MKLPENIEPQVRITFVHSGSEHIGSFGKGTAALLMGIRENGSLNRAAKNLGMAYSKAWRLMNEVEDSFGMQLVVRDGAHGSTLTPEGDALLDAYGELLEQTKAFVEKKCATLHD